MQGQVLALLGQHLYERIAGLQALVEGGGGSLVRVQPSVGQLQRLPDRLRLRRERRGSVRTADREPFALIAERRAGGLERRRERRGRAAADNAELISTHPVGGALTVDRRRQPFGEAAQQGVAGGVSEHVVVALEAVEVEDRERHRLCFGSRGQ